MHQVRTEWFKESVMDWHESSNSRFAELDILNPSFEVRVP